MNFSLCERSDPILGRCTLKHARDIESVISHYMRFTFDSDKDEIFNTDVG
jgi:hypothetical protein